LVVVKALICETFAIKPSELDAEPSELLTMWQALNLYRKYTPKAF